MRHLIIGFKLVASDAAPLNAPDMRSVALFTDRHTQTQTHLHRQVCIFMMVIVHPEFAASVAHTLHQPLQ